MNADIAEILKDNYIGDLNWVERIAGLVRPLTQVDVADLFDPNTNELIGQQTVRKVYPVACDVTLAECIEGDRYYDLIPNSDRRSIVYFEDRGTVLTGRDGKLQHYASGLRLVAWMNLEMFETNLCSISAPVIASIIKTLPTGFNNVGVYQRMRIELKNILPKNASIFSQYTYQEETNQYLLYPYDYFAMDIDVSFSIHDSCIDDLVIKDKDCAQV